MDYQGKTVRYTSNKSIEEHAQFFVGKVRKPEGDEIEINGLWHDINSIVILEEIFFEDGLDNAAE